MPEGFGKYDVYAVAGSIYCYGDTGVLRNKFEPRDGVFLRKVEADISAARQTEMLQPPILGRFTSHHLCRIHRRLLGDIYSFAGHLRREDIAKEYTRFLSHGEIAARLQKLLENLRDIRCMADMTRDELIKHSAYYFAELNYIHPFREGNGRAIREFKRLLFLRNGYEVDWGAVTVEELMQAMVNSVYDTALLERVLNRCLSPP